MSDSSPDLRTFTVKDAAAQLGMSVQSTYRAIYNAGLPVVRIGSAIRIRERDLLAWLDERTEVAA
ncbi:helix-turn-helix domain-containing protein [Microbacterium sp. YJN-G]|uniref:helix-turn-helix domain-containing protein n=1 Tax=Microbacterium sp. YJN-G TaxID=2763257 RepID=UPI0018780126|nr:helix-turn-helix domain-containing protein [Microbacterium sp. YJN-G]